MKTLKKLAIVTAAAAMSLTAAFGGAMAQSASDLTPDEKATVRLYQEFKSCVEGKYTTYSQQAESIVKARGKLSNDATRQELKDKGFSDDEADYVMEQLEQGEIEFMTQMLARKSDPQGQCIAEKNIDVNVVGPKIGKLIEEHGEGVLDIDVGPAPAPKP